MIKRVICLAGLVFFLGCSSLQVSSDYDPAYDFTKDKTFAVVSYSHEGDDTLLKDRIEAALIQELTQKGYRQVPKEKADLHFVYHTNVENKIQIDTDYSMMGYRRFGYGGAMVATTNTYEYQKGTLVIDALHPSDQKIRWRGIASDILREQKTPQKRSDYIAKVMAKIFDTFPPKP